jgi:hypothetical protein
VVGNKLEELISTEKLTRRPDWLGLCPYSFTDAPYCPQQELVGAQTPRLPKSALSRSPPFVEQTSKDGKGSTADSREANSESSQKGGSRSLKGCPEMAGVDVQQSLSIAKARQKRDRAPAAVPPLGPGNQRPGRLPGASQSTAGGCLDT